MNPLQRHQPVRIAFHQTETADFLLSLGNNSTRSDLLMFSLCVTLNQLLVNAFSTRIQIVSSRRHFEIHLVTKMSDMTQHFEVILTSFSSEECNGQFKFKIKWFVTSANELVPYIAVVFLRWFKL